VVLGEKKSWKTFILCDMLPFAIALSGKGARPNERVMTPPSYVNSIHHSH
jgi:hypothetical protein